MKMLVGIIVGGAIGFVVGFAGRCASGACPLTGNPIISTLVGAFIGAMVTAGT